jgi:hypothetical protein
LQQIEAFLERKKRLLLIVVGDSHDDFIEKLSCTLDHVEVPVCDGIETAGINCASHDLEKRSTPKAFRASGSTLAPAAEAL